MILKVNELLEYITTDTVKVKTITIEGNYECLVEVKVMVHDIESGYDLRFYTNSSEEINIVDLKIDLLNFDSFALGINGNPVSIKMMPDNFIKLLKRFNEDGLLEMRGNIVNIKDMIH